VPGVHQVIAGGLASRIGAARVVGGGFREAPRFAQGAEHLVGADVVEAETGYRSCGHKLCGNPGATAAGFPVQAGCPAGSGGSPTAP
jgi:hypothetical protein